MKTLRLLLAALLAASVLTVAARAADLSGAWKWTSVTKTGPAEITAKFVQKKDTLTGTVTGRQGPAAISLASCQDGAVVFMVVRGTGDATVVFKYSGQLSGDTISGAIERSGPKGAAPMKTDWKASRVK